MQKKIKILGLLFFSAILFSCSSSDDSTSNDLTQSPNTFNYIYQGVSVPISGIIARKSENSIVVSGQAANGQSVDVEFNKFGDLSTVESFSVSDFSFPNTSVFYNFTSNYFNFQLISIDEINKRVVVQFSGKLYEDDTNLNSTFVEVSGNFDVNYQEVVPNIPGLKVAANIGGSEWYSTKAYTNNGNSSSDFILRHQNDDRNRISIGFNSSNNNVGTYNFTPTSLTNFVRLEKYNTTTQGFDTYNCTGSLVVTSKTAVGFIGYIIEGTYSFTATNPSNAADQIQVTQGVFKSFYNW